MAGKKSSCQITSRPLEPSRLLRDVADDGAGGTVLFVGTIRNRSESRRVYALEYQVYRKMAERRMRLIEAEVRRRWPVRNVSMAHRYGMLRIGEVSVVVAVSAQHRAEAFEACRYAIDRIKATLPLWKREKLRGRNRWVEGSPIARSVASH